MKRDFEYDTPRYKLEKVADAIVDIARGIETANIYLFQAVRARAEDYDGEGNMENIQNCLNNISTETFGAMLFTARVISNCPEWTPEETKIEIDVKEETDGEV